MLFCICFGILSVPVSNLSIRGNYHNPQELDTVIIECSVIANPPANIAWLKRTSEKVRILTNSSKTFITHQFYNAPSGPHSSSILTVRNVERNDNGDYICEVRNYHSYDSANFSIIVICKFNLSHPFWYNYAYGKPYVSHTLHYSSK